MESLEIFDSNNTKDYHEYSYQLEDTTEELHDFTATEWGEIASERESVISLICRQAARYYVAIVIIFGLFGNAGCLICYRRSDELKRYRSTGYLMALALSDLTFLLCLSFVWLKSVGINWHDAQVICQASVYASNASIFLSAWYVMALTGEMAFALRRPYSAYAAAVDASKTVMIRIFFVTFVGLAVNSWTLALTQTGPVGLTAIADEESSSEFDEGLDLVTAPGYDESGSSLGSVLDLEILANETYMMPPFSYDAGCLISSNNQLLHKTFVLFDIAFTYSVPLVVTLLLNCYIGYKLIQAGRQRRHMSKSVLFSRRAAVVCHQSQNGHSSVQMTGPKDSLKRKRRAAQQLDRCPFTPMELSRLNSGQSMKKVAIRGTNLRSKEAAVSSLLIAKSMAYLIFNTPSCAHRIWSMLRREAAATTDPEAENGNTRSQDINENWVQLIIYMLFYTQFSINFLLYSWHAYSRRKCRPHATAKAILKSYHSPAPCF